VVVYKSLHDALRDGYQIYDRTEEGFLIRIKTPTGWTFALVEVREKP
jgi:hypothetical protein